MFWACMLIFVIAMIVVGAGCIVELRGNNPDLSAKLVPYGLLAAWCAATCGALWQIFTVGLP